MLRGYDYGLLAMLGAAAAYGVAWAVLNLTFGLIAVGLAGGWIVGAAIKQGVKAHRRDPHPATTGSVIVDQPIDEDPAPLQTFRRGMSMLGALLGAGAWVLGSYIAFAIVQLSVQGSGLLDPAKFAEYMASALAVEPAWLQPGVLAAFTITGWMAARPGLPKPSPVRRGSTDERR